MDFSFDHISFANLFENGRNYISFSLMGMLIVYAGLTFISIYISLLPKILNLPQVLKARRKNEDGLNGTAAAEAKDSELLLAITVALHLDQEDGGNHEKITWKRHEEQESAWLTASRMRGLAVRSHLPDRRG